MYYTYNYEDTLRYIGRYNRDPFSSWWIVLDFGKKGLETLAPPPPSQPWPMRLSAMYTRDDRTGAGTRRILLLLAPLDKGAHTLYGAAAEYWVEYTLPLSPRDPAVAVTLRWFNKTAARIPESHWFRFVPSPALAKGGKWAYDKLGYAIDPSDVVVNGSRHHHSVDPGVHLHTPSALALDIESRDAGLVSPGNPFLWDFDNEVARAEDGVSFGLSNNCWGTNYMQWYDDDALFRFTLRVK